ncbi:hypothetical protein P29A0810_076 [Synechococcus phage S-CAM8]|jgi:hypothetical protein|uniref:Gp91 n=1 Tax=Synechococcus phage S-CAM8 TaxID=754038 RepID=G8EXQ8_9CAUD|nr:hypothetical protein SXCG_00009 [Synechococcus phage S-CAM8]AET72598.1 gp91 [Synechococcus phage S-CAM8]AGN33915.1 hypothetical protein SXCG_00009 [Synechococcus phage S-CAM8]AOV60012.1 hypothetical protein P29A0810_076 [Synechococcus phage S-CAM8]
MDAKTRVERQDTRVWALEQLIRLEAFLDPRMYECADYYASAYASQVVEDLYTLWVEWKAEHLSDNPQVINRM